MQVSLLLVGLIIARTVWSSKFLTKIQMRENLLFEWETWGNFIQKMITVAVLFTRPFVYVSKEKTGFVICIYQQKRELWEISQAKIIVVEAYLVHNFKKNFHFYSTTSVLIHAKIIWFKQKSSKYYRALNTSMEFQILDA